MTTAEQLQEDIDLLRSSIDAFLDDGRTGGVDLRAAAELLTDAKQRLASLKRSTAIIQLLRESDPQR